MRDTINYRELEIIPKKKLGQHFLCKRSVADRIALCEPHIKNKTVLEIGPGPGILTEALILAGAKKLIAIEMDASCIEALEKLSAKYDNIVQIVHADAMRVDETAYADSGKLCIVANLPYNIGTALLQKWLKKATLFHSIVIMLQKEVVQRLCAKPRSKDYGRLSIITQLLCDVDEQFDVQPEDFFPQPKVISSVVSLHPYPEPLYNVNFSVLECIMREAFTKRRKMIKTSLKKSFGSKIDDVFKAMNIDDTARPEDLTIEQFAKLSSLL